MPNLLDEDEGVQIQGTTCPLPNQDQLNPDCIGEELKPDANIWRLYEKEARKHDIAFTQERSGDLENILVFSGLLLGVIGLFAANSMYDLQQDAANVTNQLLLGIARSQQRIETRTPALPSPPVEFPPFKPSAFIRSVNALYFASLMITLGAAVIALLAKEWLGAYLSYRTPHAHAYALERQARLGRLDSWHVLAIIDLLPTALIFALLIFSLGLLLHLRTLDHIVAWTITAISILVFGFYSGLLLLGALSPICPYRARITTYIRKLIPQAIFKPSTSRSTTQDNRNIEQGEIGLLTWLFVHSNKPTVRNSVAQALAGLKSLNLGLPTLLDQEVTPIELQELHERHRKALAPLYKLGALALEQLRLALKEGCNEISSYGGSSAARLAIALGEIYPHALTWQMCQITLKPLAQGNTSDIDHGQMQGPGWSLVNSPFTIDMKSVCQITNGMFSIFDMLWVDDAPLISSEVHTHLVITELQVIEHAFAFIRQTRPSLPSPAYQLIGLDEKSLQDRYNRAMNRAVSVIEYSKDRFTGKGSQAVQSVVARLLMKATSMVGQRRLLIRHGLSASNTLIATHRSGALKLELLEILLEHGWGDANAPPHRLDSFRGTAFDSLLELWTTYLRPSNIAVTSRPEAFPWSAPEWALIPFQTTSYDPQSPAEIAMYRYIVFTYIAGGLMVLLRDTDRHHRANTINTFHPVLKQLLSGSSRLSKITAQLTLNQNHTLGRTSRSIYLRWLPQNEVLEGWLLLLSEQCLSDTNASNEENRNRLTWCVGHLIAITDTLTRHSVDSDKSHRVDLFAQLRSAHSAARNATPQHPGLQVGQVMQLIYAASQATDRDTTIPVIPTLLAQVTDYIRETDCPECLRSFTEGQGFDILAEIGQVESDEEAVANAVRDILVRLKTTNCLVVPAGFPSLVEAMGHLCNRSVAAGGIEAVVGGALFQLAQFSQSSSLNDWELSSIRRLLGRLREWARPASFQAGTFGANMMASLDEEFQRWVESKDLGPPDALESDRTSNALAESQESSSTHNSPMDIMDLAEPESLESGSTPRKKTVEPGLKS